MNKIKLGLSVLGICMASSSVFAVNGVINFSGNILAGTCSPEIGGGGSVENNAAVTTVTLPTVHEGALSSAAATTGQTPFKITLKGGMAGSNGGCSDGQKIASPYFEPEISKINAAGRLINTGTAKNVDIEILDDKQHAINLLTDSTDQHLSVAKPVGDNNEYHYTARYYANEDGTVVAGSVVGSVSYSIIYK